MIVVALSCFALGVGVSYINIEHNQITYSGIVKESKENYFLFTSKFETMYVYSKANNYEIGDCLSISGNKTPLNFVTIESQFDFKDYLNKKGVYYQLNPKEIKVNFTNPIRLKAFRSWSLSHFDKDTADLLGSILFNESRDGEVSVTLSALHLNRLISASGIYLYFFYGVFCFLFGLILKDKWAELCSIGSMSIFLLFTFPKFSVIRFVTFLIIKWINSYPFKKKYDYYSLLATNSLVLLFFDYHFAYLDSFYLGFMIPLIYRFISSYLKDKKRRIKMLISSLTILIFFIPFEITYYHELSPLSYIFQFILTPLFIVYTCFGLLGSLGLPLTYLEGLFTQGIKRLSIWFSRAMIAIYLPEMNGVFLLLFNSLYFISLYYFTIGFKPIYKASLTLLGSFLLLYALPIKNTFTNSVTFINVGQGDACLIRKQNTTVLIDTGGSIYQDIATECLIPYFKKNRIYNLDLLITTHDDFDHSGALPSLKDNFVIKNIITNKEAFPVSISGINFYNYNTYFTSYSSENDQSLVIGFSLSNLSYLIMGDAPTSIEKKIMNDYTYIPCDILKVGHHGSDTSSSEPFIKFLSPKEAIISVGRNYYGHPKQSVLNILKKNNVKIRQTNIEGSITYLSYAFG